MDIFWKYIYIAAQIYANYAYAYYTHIIRNYTCVNTHTYTCIYVCICLFVMHSLKSL